MKKLQILLIVLASLLFLGMSQTATAQKRTTGQGTKSFVVTNGKLGPIQLGSSMANIPRSVAGLYDKFTKETVNRFDGDIGDEDGPTIQETIFSFYKNGKNIFNVTADEKLVAYNIELMEGSSYIKTAEGYFVGYSAREFFKKHSRGWDNDYTEGAFVDSRNCRYYVEDRYMNVEIPTKVSNFTANAKITKIYCFKKL